MKRTNTAKLKAVTDGTVIWLREKNEFIASLQSQNEQMKQVLEWYALSNIKDIFDDGGDRAREALKVNP